MSLLIFKPKEHGKAVVILDVFFPMAHLECNTERIIDATQNISTRRCGYHQRSPTQGLLIQTWQGQVKAISVKHDVKPTRHKCVIPNCFNLRFPFHCHFHIPHFSVSKGGVGKKLQVWHPHVAIKGPTSTHPILTQNLKEVPKVRTVVMAPHRVVESIFRMLFC